MAASASRPDYSVVAVDGTKLSRQALLGKIVLYRLLVHHLPACVAAVSSLRDLQKKYADAPFVIVGVSTDRDDYAWRRFTVDQRMIWPQFWDRRRDVASTFGIIGYPTQVLVDGEGIEQMRIIGDGFHRSRSSGRR